MREELIVATNRGSGVGDVVIVATNRGSGLGDVVIVATIRAAASRLPPFRLLGDCELVAGTLQCHSRGSRVDDAEVDIELRPKRDGRQVAEQARSARSRFVCRDRLVNRSLPDPWSFRPGSG